MNKKRTARLLGKIFLFLLFNIIFTAVVVWIAYSNRVRFKKWMDHSNDFNVEDKAILYDIFSAPLVNNTQDLVYPAVKNSDELLNYLNNASLPDSLNPLNVFDTCRVLSVSPYRNDIIKITYKLYADTLHSYVYYERTGTAGKNHTAVLFTCGTGDNRVSQVAHRLLKEEDPYPQAEMIGADIYYPIYPADDVTAIHDGKKKLAITKISSYMVSVSRNMPLRFLADIFALEKYLRSKYRILHSWGHSRGGMAAAISASIFHPDTAIINAGYSVSLVKFFRLGPDQMWWANCEALLNKDAMKNRLCGKNTAVYFLWGTKEQDIFGLETKYNHTKDFYKDCPNVKTIYAAGKGHQWFSDEVSEILKGKK